MSSRPPRAPHRLFRALVRLFPFEFRAEFEPEMEAVFDDQRRDAPTRRHRLLLWVRTLGDMLRAALREHLDILRQDTRFAVRLLRRNPGFAFTAILTLALGIGANTAVFSLVRAVLLRPLPYLEPDRLVSVANGGLRRDGRVRERNLLTGDDVLAFRRHATSVDGVAAIHTFSHELTSPVDILLPDGAERLRAGLATPNFFETLGVHAAVGRLFGSRDTEGAPLAVISDGYWRRKFGGDPRTVGRSVDLLLVGRRERAPRRFTIVGVLPPRFRFTYPRETELWAMLPWSGVQPRGAIEYEMIARLAPGVAPEQAAAELTGITTRQWPGYRNVTLVTPLPELASGGARAGVLLLSGVTVVVLLIACVNVILLLLGRVSERGSEMAVRTALGAGVSRIGRQLFVETGILVAAGGVAGVGLAFVLQPVLRALVPAAVTRGDELSVDIPVLGFAATLCLVLTFACGVAPLWQVSTRSLHERLQQRSWHTSAGVRVALWRRGVVMLQVAAVLVLLVCGTLLLDSFWRLRHVDLGHWGRDLLTMEVNALGPRGRDRAHITSFERSLLERVRTLPGVADASATTSVPMRGVDYLRIVSPVGGRKSASNERSVDHRYFGLMRIPVVEGRRFNERDTADSEPVAIVSQSFSRVAFGDRSPLGERLDLDEVKPVIVGVVGDVRHKSTREAPAPAYYLPRPQDPTPVFCLVVRTTIEPATVAAGIRAIVHDLDPAQPVERITTLGAIVDETTAGDRFNAVTTGAFGVIALLLATAGLMGVVRRSVAERTRELAIRAALGADGRTLVFRTVAEALQPMLAGAAVGLLGAFWGSRLLQRFLFEISPLDPWAYGAALLLLGATAFAGAYFPARRIARIDPASVLKGE